MSYKVKPEDVTLELAEKCWLHVRGEGPSAKWSISEVINAAIEAGLVSPPCWVMRVHERIAKDMNHEPNVFPSRRDDSKHLMYEHWKGQTE